MAAGIGEASAILAVAQLGISLSNTLIAYIADVKDAPNRIQRVGNEILTTSERLKEIGELINKNDKTKIFSVEGISSAIRCSDECEKIIEEVKTVIQKNKRQPKSKEFKKDEIDISLFSTLRWPFVKIRLEVPRAELQRIKIDLSLLFSSAMALGASTAAEKVKFQSDIPGLQRTRDWAAKRSKQARQRAEGQYRRQPVRERRETYMMDNEPELLQKFIEFEERRARDEEDQKARDRVALMQLEEDKKKTAQKKEQEHFERNAVERYKDEQAKIETRNNEKKESFGKELERLGFSHEQIESIFESPNLSFNEANGSLNFPNAKTDPVTQQPSNSNPLTGIMEGEKILPGSKSSHKFPWRRSKKSIIGTDEKHRRPLSDLRLADKVYAAIIDFPIEIWLIDMFSGQRVEVSPSEDWLVAKTKLLKKRQDVWHQFSLLRPSWRSAIIDLIDSRNQGGDRSCPWVLYYFETPRRQWRASLLGQMREDQLLQLILYKRDQPDQGKINSTPKDGPHAPRTLASRFPASKMAINQTSSDPILDIQDSSLKTKPLKSALKGQNSFTETKSFRQASPRVVFADSTAEDDSKDIGLHSDIDSPHLSQSIPFISLTENFGRVVVGAQTEGTGLEPPKIITCIPTDLVSSDTAEELEYPHYVQSGFFGESNKKFSVLVVEKPLTVSEVQRLIRHTREKMVDGELPWKPERILEFLEISDRNIDLNPIESVAPLGDGNNNEPLRGEDYRRDGSSRKPQRGFPMRADASLHNNSNPYSLNITEETYFPYNNLNRPRGRYRERDEGPPSPVPIPSEYIIKDRSRRRSPAPDPRDGFRSYQAYVGSQMGKLRVPDLRKEAINIEKGRDDRAWGRDEYYFSPSPVSDYDKDESSTEWGKKVNKRDKPRSWEHRESARRQDEREQRDDLTRGKEVERRPPSFYPNSIKQFHRSEYTQEYDPEKRYFRRRPRKDPERKGRILGASSGDTYYSHLPLETTGGPKGFNSWPGDRISERRSQYMKDTQSGNESSEDYDDGFYPIKDGQFFKNQGQDTELSDKEIILNTLKRLTTLTGDKLPELVVPGAVPTMATAGMEMPEPTTDQENNANVEARRSSESSRLGDLVVESVELTEEDQVMFAIAPTDFQSDGLGSRSGDTGRVVEILSEKGWESVSEHESITAVPRRPTAEDES